MGEIDDMRKIDASDAEKAFPELLDAVEGGETIAIERDGVVVATLIPDAEARHRRAAELEACIAEIRSKVKPTTIEEILAWRHEGHKY